MTTTEGKTLAIITDEVRSMPIKQLDELADTLAWGTYGISGDQSMRKRTLNSLETDHLENILITQKQISYIYAKVILHILKMRYLDEAGK